MPKISVIVPVYNVEKYLPNCVNSILMQTFTDFELILVNDGSTDHSGELCDNLAKADARIRVIHKENGGVSSARNCGIEHAQGRYITFVDSDDEVTEKYLEDLEKNEQFDYVVSGFINTYANQDDGIIRQNMVQYQETFGKNVLDLPECFFINGLVHSCWGKLFRRDIIVDAKIKFPYVRLSEDTFFNLEYLKYIESWIIIDKSNYIYLHREKGKNATSKFELIDVDVYIQLHQALSQLGIKTKTVKHTIYAQYLAICLRLLKQKNMSDIEKTKLLKDILAKGKIKSTLLTTFSNKGEWLLGFLICTYNIKLINKWLWRQKQM